MSENPRDSSRFDFQEAWVIAACSVLVVYVIGQLRPESELGTIATGGWLLVWMTLLSFPTGLLFLLFILIIGFMDYGLNFFTMLYIWAGLFGVGYWQWCRFVPSLLSREMITLDLASGNNRTVGPARAEPDSSRDFKRQPEVIARSRAESDERL
ncbi:MAG TPA: hypothetical protein VGX92_10310 [Pyrinomonadaceae bacterium]|jgi:hypothetical protein|nr:hypothetical protein [Pyrinomonadaceae bacterium]